MSIKAKYLGVSNLINSKKKIFSKEINEERSTLKCLFKIYKIINDMTAWKNKKKNT